MFPFWPWATTSTMMFRKSVLDLVLDGTEYAMDICADNYICHFSNLIGESILMPDIYSCYRRHYENNFATNPYINNRIYVGDMNNHPDHREMKNQIRKELLKKSDIFLKLLSFRNYSKMVMYVTGITELPNTVIQLMRTRKSNTIIVFLKLLLLYTYTTCQAIYIVLTRKLHIRMATIRDFYPKELS